MMVLLRNLSGTKTVQIMRDIEVASGRGEDHQNDDHSIHEVSTDVRCTVEVLVSALDLKTQVGDVRLSTASGRRCKVWIN